MNGTGSSNGTSSPEYDAVIVGGSLAGCTTAMLLGREGLRVALVEKQPDPAAFKRVCSHFIQASAVPTLERLDLFGPIVAAGGRRSRIQAWTEWGWIKPPPRRPASGSTCAARSSTRWFARRRLGHRASTSIWD
jgi:menaquinone-9 beta-reductase